MFLELIAILITLIAVSL